MKTGSKAFAAVALVALLLSSLLISAVSALEEGVDLSATILDPLPEVAVSADVDSIDFGTMHPGEISDTVSVTITNAGSRAVSVSAIAVDNGDEPIFSNGIRINDKDWRAYHTELDFEEIELLDISLSLSDETSIGYHSGSVVLWAEVPPQEGSLLSSTYFNGGSIGTPEVQHALALGDDGTIYLTGTVSSGGYATEGAYDTTYNGKSGEYVGGSGDTFIARFSADMSTLLAYTYLGGSANEQAFAIAVAEDGTVYVGGMTSSGNLATDGAYSSLRNGAVDAFIARFSPDLSELLAFTYFGGSTTGDIVYALDIAGDGTVYVGGMTSSGNLATEGAYDTVNTLSTDAFVAKFSADLSTLQACTYFGIEGKSDDGYYISVTADGSVYLTGRTWSSGLATEGAYDTVFGSGGGYIAKFSSDLTTLQACTYFGGGNADARCLALAPDGSVYLAGYTQSSNLATEGAYDTTYDYRNDAFIAHFSSDLTTLMACTYFGGSDMDNFRSIILGEDGVYAFGSAGAGIEVTENAFQPALRGEYGSDCIVVKFSLDLSDLLYSSYLGGSSINRGWSCALDHNGNLIVVGGTTSTDFPTRNAYSGANTGYENIFVAVFLFGDYVRSEPVARFSADVTSGGLPLTVQFTDESIFEPAVWQWDFDGDGNIDSHEQNPSWTYSEVGVYTVTLTVTNAAGSDTVTKTDYVTVS